MSRAVKVQSIEMPMNCLVLTESIVARCAGQYVTVDEIAEGKIDILIFYCDNLIMQRHQQDVGALSILASLYNIPFAVNRTTADMILTSPLFDDDKYERIIPACIEKYVNKTL